MNSGASSKRSPLKFFVLVFGLAIPVWILGAIVEPPEDFPIKLPVSALQLFCPLIAAAILVYREDGLAAVRNLLKRTLSYRGIKPRWLVAILLLSPTVYLLSFGDPAITGPIYATAAVVVTLLWGARTLAQYRYSGRRVRAPSTSPTTS